MTQAPWIKEVLDFWFKELTKKEWFISSTELDESIKRRFLGLHEQVSDDNNLNESNDPQEILAAIIVLDQFSRNLFRGTERAFASDAKALNLAKHALEIKISDSLNKDEKQFLFMPFMHSENLADHQTAMPYFIELDLTKHAEEHIDIIERFGRFPHRNDVLGRVSSDEELAYLENGKRFGQ